jgi:hypothetical protein
MYMVVQQTANHHNTRLSNIKKTHFTSYCIFGSFYCWYWAICKRFYTAKRQCTHKVSEQLQSHKEIDGQNVKPYARAAAGNDSQTKQ